MLVALLSLVGCAAPLREVRPDAPRARLALGVAEPRERRRVAGVEVAIHDSDPGGRRPALLCLHAIAHGGGDFAAVEAGLSDRWRVITVDWPGHGFSGDDARPASAARYAEVLEALIEDLRLSRVVILGNSIGGAAAIRYAADHPDRVRALVLANPGGLDPGGFIARIFIGSLVRRFEQGERNEARFEPWFRDYYADILVTPAAAARREAIVAAGYEHAAILVQAWRSFAEPEASLEAIIPRVTMPVFFAWAREDHLIRWSRNEDAVRRFPAGEVVFFDGGHSPFLETPGPFLQQLGGFLDRLP
jgi:4,5:9,10-diseco-3-hydroxy-5,9,17-trioxoandrosta-1(10),2-diene-4-oate hydrolase